MSDPAVLEQDILELGLRAAVWLSAGDRPELSFAVQILHERGPRPRVRS